MQSLSSWNHHCFGTKIKDYLLGKSECAKLYETIDFAGNIVLYIADKEDYDSIKSKFGFVIPPEHRLDRMFEDQMVEASDKAWRNMHPEMYPEEKQGERIINNKSKGKHFDSLTLDDDLIGESTIEEMADTIDWWYEAIFKKKRKPPPKNWSYNPHSQVWTYICPNCGSKSSFCKETLEAARVKTICLTCGKILDWPRP